MASLSIEELISAIRLHPRYKLHWEKGTPAEQALYITFSEKEVENVISEDFAAENGRQIIVDKNRQGQVVGIEIV